MQLKQTSLTLTNLLGAVANGCVGVGGTEPPGEEVVSGLAVQPADIAGYSDGGELTVVLPLDLCRACECPVRLRQGGLVGYHQRHLPADPPRRGRHGVEPRALGLPHHLLVRVVHEPDAVAGVGDHRRERVDLQLRLHLNRRLRGGGGAGRVGAVDAPDVDGGAHGAHRPGRDDFGLQQLPQQVALHGDVPPHRRHLRVVLGTRTRRRERRQREARTDRDDRGRMRARGRRARERRVQRRRSLPLGWRLRARARLGWRHRHDGGAAAFPRAARPALQMAQHAVRGHDALGRQCGLGRDGPEPRQDLVGLDGRVRWLHHGHGEARCRCRRTHELRLGGQVSGLDHSGAETTTESTALGARTGGQARLKKGGAANRTRAEGGARGRARRGTWATGGDAADT